MKWLNGILVPRVFVAPRSWSWARTRHVTSDAIQEVQWLPNYLNTFIYMVKTALTETLVIRLIEGL